MPQGAIVLVPAILFIIADLHFKTFPLGTMALLLLMIAMMSIK